MIDSPRYRTPLCPYLMLGNHRMLAHLDAFGNTQSLQWPYPGAPDRLGWRNPCDEWPYWNELSEEEIRLRMPYVEYASGGREFLQEAVSVDADYLRESNVLSIRCVLPGGAVVEQILFVDPERDVFLRNFRISGGKRFVFRGGFLEKAVRGHELCHLGKIPFRGFLDAFPRGVFVIASDATPERRGSETGFDLEKQSSFTLYLAMAETLEKASGLAVEAEGTPFPVLLERRLERDRKFISRAGTPRAEHPFLRKNYKRWILSNALLIGENGASVSGVRPFWSFAWPRDCAQQAMGFAAAGFSEEAEKILAWNLRNAPESGVYEARYRADSTPVELDNRPPQGDSAGFLCHAVLYLLSRGGKPEWFESVRKEFFFLADRILKRIDPETGLPLPSGDHRETQIAESFSVAAASVAGLRAAARLAPESRKAEYLRGGEGILRAMERNLLDPEKNAFITSVRPENRKADISFCWAASPFRIFPAGDARLGNSLLRIWKERWNQESGGILSMPGTEYASFWMYYTTLFLNAAAEFGRRDWEERILDALERNVSPQGLVPEQISLRDGLLAGCAPLPPPQANLLYYAFEYGGSFEIAPPV